MEGKFKDFTPEEIIDYIRQKQVESDDEWLLIDDWITGFLQSDSPEEEKQRFAPLGYAEVVLMICDGIRRWRNSICIKCRKQEGYGKCACSIYQHDERLMGGIPNEIWANEDADCPYFEER